MTADRCIAPEEIRDGDLLAYLDGEQTMTLISHIARCRFCQQELVALERMMDLFVAAYGEEGGGGGHP